MLDVMSYGITQHFDWTHTMHFREFLLNGPNVAHRLAVPNVVEGHVDDGSGTECRSIQYENDTMAFMGYPTRNGNY